VINEKLRLSVGPTPAARVAGAVSGVVFAGFGLLFALGAVAIGRFFGDPPAAVEAPDVCTFEDGALSCAPGGGSPVVTADHVVALVGVLFALVAAYLVLKLLRTAAWLDGSTLRLRGAVRTRSVDLATADVSAGVAESRVGDDDARYVRVSRVPTLVARDRASGRRVVLQLRGLGLNTLPAYELRALADAMTVGRPEEGRDADAHVVAGQLRALAGNPLGL
jgi:hypothetical protein